ncbi:MAG: hypothetical protein ACTSYB_11440 [Candidatus Helarchaeota archaeon]
MGKSEIDSEERKITVESKATLLFLIFILIEGYILISSANGFYPYSIIGDFPPYEIVLTSIPGLYALYWAGILFLILGLLIGNYDKVIPPVALILSIIIFLALIFQ